MTYLVLQLKHKNQNGGNLKASRLQAYTSWIDHYLYSNVFWEHLKIFLEYFPSPSQFVKITLDKITGEISTFFMTISAKSP